MDLEEKPTTYSDTRESEVRDNIHSEDVARFIECFLQVRDPVRFIIGGGKKIAAPS